MTTLCFFSATGGELTLVSQALARMRADGLDAVSYTHLTLPTKA